MQAVAAVAYGGPENFKLIDVPARDPGLGEVVVRVRASGLNPIDWKLASGARGADPAALPMRLGFEAAGVIAALGASDLVGADGTALALGQEVIAYRAPGAHAEELTVSANAVLQRPASLGVEAAAGLLLVATTAEDGLQLIGVGDGDVLLVHGGAGSVGRAVIQLAVQRGARVIATTRPTRHAALRRLGAEPVAYGPGLLERVRAIAPRVDAVFDTAGTDEAVAVSLALVADRTRFVTVANAQAVTAAGGRFVGGGDPRSQAVRDAARPELVRLAAAGRLEIPVVATFPMAEARSAYELLIAGHAGGKIVLLP